MTDFNNYTIDDIRKDIASFKNDTNVNKLTTYYKTKSMAEILGVSRKEIQHSNFLAWILNKDETHYLGDFAIKKLLDIYVLYCNEQIHDKKLFDLVITDTLKIDSIKTEVEKTISTGRLDIFIELKIVDYDEIDTIRLIIENKVTAKETKDQTQRYFNYFEDKKTDKTVNFYLYLTPISTLQLIELTKAQCKCKEFIQINYQTIVDLILEPLLQRDIATKTKYLIEQYLQSLSQPSFDENSEQKEGLIMAIGNEERELLTKFWDNNQNLILASLYAISSDPTQEKDVRDSITTALDSISNNTKDRSKINIKYKNEIVASDFKKSDIGFQTVKLLEREDLITESIFNLLRTDTSSSFILLKLEGEIKDNEKKYAKYRYKEEAEFNYKDEGYYIARNWGINNIDKFIKKIQDKFINIKFEIN
jgi:hypothetical protein